MMKRPKLQRGSAAVEFAVVLLPLMLVLLGIMEYGWIFLQEFNVADAVREGVRLGVTIAPTAAPDPPTTAINRAKAVLKTLNVNTTGATITADYDGSAAPDLVLKVAVSIPYKPIIGFLPKAAMPANIVYRMTMMMEQQN